MSLDDPTRTERLEMACDEFLQSIYKKQVDIHLEDFDEEEDFQRLLSAQARAGFGAGILAYKKQPELIRERFGALGYDV